MKINLFKYMPINKYTLTSLKNSELYFSEPYKFNDIFDSTHIGGDFKLFDWFKEKIPNSGTRDISIAYLNVIEREIREGKSSSKVCCFTKKKDNLLMWSHYASSHSGICLQFKMDESRLSGLLEFSVKGESFDESRFCRIGDDNNLHRIENGDYNKLILTIFIHPVIYQKERPPHTIKNPKKQNSLVSYHLIKGNEWSYEKEYRAVLEQDMLKSNLVKYEKSRLTGVIFGARISDKNREEIKKLIAQEYINKGFSVNYYQARINEAKFKNSLLIDKVE